MKPCWREIGIAGDHSCPELALAIHCRNCREYSRAGRTLFDRPAAGALVEEWSRTLATGGESVAPARLQSVVIFRLKDEWFALPTRAFAEVADWHAPHSLPFRTGGAFLGIVNINGELLLAVSLAFLLGLGDACGVAGSGRRTCVISRDHQRFAFPVDEVLGMRKLEADRLGAPPSTVAKAAARLTASLFTHEGRSVGLLDEDKLFALLAGCLAW